MNITDVLAELRTERARIDQAIGAITALNSTGRQRGRRAGVTTAPKRGRRGLSAAARAKLSRLLKQRWAQGKMKPGTKATPTQASKPVRHMSAAGRKRIAEAAKRRWAAWRKRKTA